MNLIDEIKFDARTFRQELTECGGVVDEVIAIIKRMVHGSGEGDDGRVTCQIEVTDPEDWFQKQKGGGGSSKNAKSKKKSRNQGEF
jgi:hypothetical protein